MSRTSASCSWSCLPTLATISAITRMLSQPRRTSAPPASGSPFAAMLTDAWAGYSDPTPPVTDGPRTSSSAIAPDERGARQLKLQIGDILIFEEVLGPMTGQAPDADPSHRQPVRLTSVTPGIDPL